MKIMSGPYKDDAMSAEVGCICCLDILVCHDTYAPTEKKRQRERARQREIDRRETDRPTERN